jgi:hypothetical protein
MRRFLLGSLASAITHTVQSGEGITQIALRYYGSWDPEWKLIAKANGYPSENLNDPRLKLIFPGQKITVPANVSQTVTNDTPINDTDDQSSSMPLLLGLGVLLFLLMRKKRQ